MSRHVSLSLMSLLAAVLAAPSVAHAANNDPLSCTVNVTYSLDNAPQLTYDRTFVVSPAAPFSEDFSTATRERTFEASVAVDAGDPVVAISFFADVSVFNAVAFNASLRVGDKKGSSTAGDSSFFSSVAGAAGAHRTSWTLSCVRARN